MVHHLQYDSTILWHLMMSRLFFKFSSELIIEIMHEVVYLFKCIAPALIWYDVDTISHFTFLGKWFILTFDNALIFFCLLFLKSAQHHSVTATTPVTFNPLWWYVHTRHVMFTLDCCHLILVHVRHQYSWRRLGGKCWSSTKFANLTPDFFFYSSIPIHERLYPSWSIFKWLALP